MNTSGQLIGAGILLIGVTFTPLYSGYLDWPGAIGFGTFGLGTISVGTIYLPIGLYTVLVPPNGNVRFGAAVGGVLLLVPVLIGIYWLCGRLGAIVQTPRLDVLAGSAFAYLPVALGVLLGRTTNPSSRLGVVLLAAGFITIPAYQLLQPTLASDGWVVVVPIGWVATLVYDGLFAYPLYRFGKRQRRHPD